jgi:class 3 adenylate cyclase/tetratricopeptide (TPR) repeat protein
LRAIALFVDLSGFTPLTEALMQHAKDGAEILTDALNRIFTQLVHEVYARGGFISTFAGDAFTALFPLNSKQAASHATQVAFFVQAFFAENHTLHTKYGAFELGAKCGLALGEVQWGILGEEDRHTYFFRGEAIDACAAAEHHAERGEIIATQAVWSQLGDAVQAEPIPDTLYHKLVAAQSALPTKRIRRLTLDQDTLARFVLPDVINLTALAEFREVCSVFISIEQTASHDTFHAFVIALRELVAQYGGYFNRLDFGDKGAVALVLFGAPIAHGNDVERAANFLLTLQQSPTVVRWRAGLTIGMAYAGLMGGAERCEYTAMGDVVNLAARFMMQAPWGEVWVSEAVRERLQHTHHWIALGKFAFKGVSKPIPVYRLTGQQEHVAREFYTGELVGREAELARLETFVQPILDLTGFSNLSGLTRFAGILYLYGEAGMGKSRLAHEFRQRLTRAYAVSWFVCPAEEILRQSLNPFKYFLRNYFGQSVTHTPAENRERFDAQLQSVIARLPAAHPDTPMLRHELERTRSFLGALVNLHWDDSLYAQVEPQLRFENTLDAVKQLLKAESLLQPVVLVVEDAHWLDADSQALLTMLTRNIAAYPIAILCLSRYQDDGRPFALPVAPETPQQTLDLNRLSPDGLRALASQTLRGAVSAALVDFLAEKTNGNPFLVEQLCQHLRERTWLTTDATGAYTLLGTHTAEVPVTIGAVLIARLDRLTMEVKAVVQTAAVLGREFEAQILSGMLRDDARVTEKIKQAETEAIWSALNEIRYIFRHALLRDAAYDMQLRARLRDLHRLAGEAFEQVYADDLDSHYADLAYHFEQAQVTMKALAYLGQAGDSAKADYHNQAALDFYARRMTLMVETEQPMGGRIATRLKQGEVLELIGKWNEADATYHEALQWAVQANEREWQARAHYALCELLRRRGKYAESLVSAEQALVLFAAIGNSQGLAQTFGTFGTIARQQGNYAQAMQWYERQLKLGEALNDQAGIAAAMGSMGNAYQEQEQHTQALTCHAHRLRFCEGLGDKRGIASVLSNLGNAHVSAGDYAQALACYTRGLQLSEELGDKRVIAVTVGNLGVVSEDLGDYEQAMTYYTRSLQIGEELGNQRTISIAIGNQGNIHQFKGNYPQALVCYDQALAIAQTIGLRYYVAGYLIEKARVLFKLNQLAEAQRMAQEGLTLARAVNFPDYIFKGQVLATSIAWAQGQHDEASQQLTALLAQPQANSEQADLHYELWKMTDAEAHRAQALALYQTLLQRTPKFEWRQRAEELQVG